MHHSRSEVAQMIPDINDFTDGLVSNKVELDGTVDSINNSVMPQNVREKPHLS